MLRLTDVSFAYPGAPLVLDRFSMTGEPGERIAVCGASGCGKSTLFRLICALETPANGIIERTENETCSVVFQQPRLLPKKSALDNAALAAPKETALHWLAQFGLGDVAKDPVETLSGGMQRRVALARAAAFGGDILLLDEAFQGIDHARKESIFELLRAAYRDKIVLFATHDSSEVAAFATRTITL